MADYKVVTFLAFIQSGDIKLDCKNFSDFLLIDDVILSPPVCQVVLSYSNQLGEKRTRVHTLTLRCSRHLQDTFRNFQAQTLLAFYCKKSKASTL